MTRRRTLTDRMARAMGRPRGGAMIVRVGPELYEVRNLKGGGRKVFRLELVYVEQGSPEFERVTDVVERAHT